ncbi:MAG: UDP-glucose 4-epimerase GalE [Heyndrickxia sp.]
MAFLVTGGAGYIGSHTIIELVNKGNEVIIVDNLSNSKLEVLNRLNNLTGRDIKFYQLDLTEKEKLAKVFSENKIDAVIHFAGLKAVGESVEKSLLYYHNNIISTLVLCEVMEEYGVERLVFSSSATVYGVPERVPITEDFPLRAINPYGRTKLMIEEVLNDLSISNNRWKISILRYFNPVGAHVSGEIGEDPNGIPNNLMPYITKVAAGKLPELKVFGANYPTPDGTGIRDYIHVSDLALGHLKALEKNFDRKGIHTYNLGTGKGYSVLEVINAFERSTGISIPYSISERRPGDAAICFADTTKADKELDWSSTKELEEMCTDSWRWQSKYPDGYNSKPTILTS